jgi:uncharacterized protein
MQGRIQHGRGLDYWNSVVSWELKFEWHDAKAEANLQAHGISFDLAKTVFNDVFALERVDDREDYGEERFVIIGMAKDHIMLYVAYTERDQRIRIISARRATQYEQDDYFRQNAQSTQTNDRRPN